MFSASVNRSGTVAKRFVVCIDGTWCTADGPNGRGLGNITNVYRICASVKTGICQSHDGKYYDQVSHYEAGIGSADEIGSFQRLKAGISGDGYADKIRKIYELCCAYNEQDEIWLFGFSRGAYIARAVAGLLDSNEGIGALKSAKQDFGSDYKLALKVHGNKLKNSKIGNGQVDQFRHQYTKPAPTIKFVGIFDTVKALDDHHLHNISFNGSIQHMRQALALNENREAMKPESLYPDLNKVRDDRTFIQAWFAGAHIDMGGSAEHDGLSLYPLQWMLLESQAQGLVTEFSHFTNAPRKIDNPLSVVFPERETDGKGSGLWSCTVSNGIKVRMHDLRTVHNLTKYHRRYDIELNRRPNAWPKQNRSIFTSDEKLRGFCSFKPQGTIIHPSVYYLLDDNSKLSLHRNAWPHRTSIEICRKDMLGLHGPHELMEPGFWTTRPDVELSGVKALRILVCGKAGIGKSTLINRVFGVSDNEEVAAISQRSRGIHRVETPITHRNRPDLIIHDSRGFEAGAVDEVRKVEDFVKLRASQSDVQERLHVIWFCIELSDNRVGSSATEALFETVSKHATDVPIIIVATKSDIVRSCGKEDASTIFQDLGPADYERVINEYADDQVGNNLKMIEHDLSRVDGSRWDGCVAVSQKDPASIQQLHELTMNSFSHEKVRLVYVAAQTVDVDTKIEHSMLEVMRVYKNVLGTAAGLGLIPTAPTTNRTAAAYSICQHIVRCFGVGSLDARTVYQIVKQNVWDDISHNISIAFAEGIATVGLGSSVLLGGMPLFLVSGLVNLPIVVPATTRLMLMLAVDLILILTRAYKKTAYTCIGQPQEKDIQHASLHYAKFSGKVHKEILALVPRRNLAASFRCEKVAAGLRRVINRHKDQVAEDVDVLASATIYKPVHSTGSRRNSKMLQTRDAELDAEIEATERDVLPNYNALASEAKKNGSNFGSREDQEFLEKQRELYTKDVY